MENLLACRPIVEGVGEHEAQNMPVEWTKMIGKWDSLVLDHG